MAAIKLIPSSHWADAHVTPTKKYSIFWKVLAFADSESKQLTLWFIISLIVQGVFFLPIPAVLMYYYNAPVVCVVITLALFFANVILGMGGAGIRTIIFCFALSIALHLAMLAIFIL
jgi:hypothetical protein